MALPKLIDGKRYVITGAEENFMKSYKDYDLKFPQTVKYDGDFFQIKTKLGNALFEPQSFIFKEFPRKAKVEIHKNRKGHYYTVKGANGKKLNHDYNSKRGCLNGIEALRQAMADFEIVDLTKPGK